MLNLNSSTLDQVIRSAKRAVADDSRWLHAIERAAAELESNPWVARDGGALLVSSPSGQLYTASGGACQCSAYAYGRPCWHRAAARLVQRHDQAQQRQRAYERALAEIHELF